MREPPVKTASGTGDYSKYEDYCAKQEQSQALKEWRFEHRHYEPPEGQEKPVADNKCPSTDTVCVQLLHRFEAGELTPEQCLLKLAKENNWRQVMWMAQEEPEGEPMIAATSKDKVSITSDADETVIMSGRLWLIYHEIGTSVMEATDEDDTDIESLTKDLRRNSHNIALAILRARAIK